MARSWLSICVAACLAMVSLAVFAGRYCAEGSDQGTAPGETTWRVTLVASGTLAPRESSVTTLLPPDFRKQHIFDERFHSKDLMPPRGRKDAGRLKAKPEAVWQRSNPTAAQPYRLSCSFRCLLGMRQPTPAMAQLTALLDAAPDSGAELKPSARIESDHAEIFDKARELAGDGLSKVDQVHACLRFVGHLGNEPLLGPMSALGCLRNESGDSGGKSRLLIALCRNRGIPARLLSGLILIADQQQGLHHWVEAWVNQRWLPMCPTFHHFDTRRFPRHYLVLHIGDDDIVRQKGTVPAFGFVVDAGTSAVTSDEQTPSVAQRLWRLLSFSSLRPAEQHLVKFLLLLPLAALIVSVFRIVIGTPTFGTFGPALLGLAFLDVQSLRWGLVIFVAIVLVGWGLRHFIEGFHLLLVPRMAILLSLIVLFLILVVSIASRQGLAVTQFISLFPLVILTHLVERFWTVEAEDGTAAAFRTLLGTMFVAVSISVLLSPEAVSEWLFRHPETLGLVLAGEFLLGRYTGYRLTELYRFQDLLHEDAAAGRTT